MKIVKNLYGMDLAKPGSLSRFGCGGAHDSLRAFRVVRVAVFVFRKCGGLARPADRLVIGAGARWVSFLRCKISLKTWEVWFFFGVLVVAGMVVLVVWLVIGGVL